MVAYITTRVSTFEATQKDSDTKITKLEEEKAELEKDAKAKDEKVDTFEKAEKARKESEGKVAEKSRSDFIAEHAKKVEPKHQPMFLALLASAETSKATFSINEGGNEKEVQVAEQLKAYIAALPDDKFDEHGKEKGKEDDGKGADKDDVDKAMDAIAKKHGKYLSKTEDYEWCFERTEYKPPKGIGA